MLNISDFPEQLSQSTTEEKVIYLINHAALLSDEPPKLVALKQVQELIVHKEPQLLDRYVNEILAFLNDRSLAVKKAVLDFIEEICRKNPENLSKVLGHINIILRDSNAILQKRVIQISTTFYKMFLEWITKSNKIYISDMTHQIWIFMKNIKSFILNLQESENDGIRTQVIKFMEMIVLCQSCKSADSYHAKMTSFSLDDIPERHKFLRYLQLEEESKQIFSNMISLCGSNTISHSNLNTLLGSLTDIALQRPQYMAKVISSFESLYNNIPPTLAKSQVSSIKKGLKNRLLSLIKHPSSVEHQNRMITILMEMGVQQHEITKLLPKVSKLNHALTDTTKKGRLQRKQDQAQITVPQDSTKVGLGLKSEPGAEFERMQEELYQMLNPENVTQLVMRFMPNLPDVIPHHFINHYQPITQAGSRSHIMKLADILARKAIDPVIDNENIGKYLIFVQIMQRTVELGIDTTKREQATKWKNEKDIAQTNQQISTAPAKSSLPFSHLLKKAFLAQKTPHTYDLIQRSVKLRDILGKIEASREKDESLMEPLMGNFNKLEHCRDAIMRILELDSWLPSGQNSANANNNLNDPFLNDPHSKQSNQKERISIVTKLANTQISGPQNGKLEGSNKNVYGECLREVIVDYLLEDLKGQYDLAIALLYEEYAQFVSPGGHGHKREGGYNKFISLLIETVIEKSDCKEELLPRLLIEAPLITLDAIDILRSYCAKGNDTEFYFNTVLRLADLRPKMRDTLFTRLILDFVSHPTNQEIRKNTISIIYDVYETKDYSSIIDNHAIKQLGYLTLKSPPEDICNNLQLMKTGIVSAPETADVQWTEESIKICLHLFLSILPINHKLIQNLFNIYIEASPEIKRVILRSIEVPIRTMGVDSVELIGAIKKCPKGAETLVTRVVHILTGRGGSKPNSSLVRVVRWLYESGRVPDVRLLIPVIHGLSRDEILTLLPKFIGLNSVPLIKEVLTRVITIPDDRDRSILTPSELLVAFHMIPISPASTLIQQPQQNSKQPTPVAVVASTSADDKTLSGSSVPGQGFVDEGSYADSSLEVKVESVEDGTCDMRVLIRAIGICFANKRVFSPEVLAITIESLVEVQPLPVLFMRLVIQSIVQYHPQLIDFIIKILYELIKHEIWTQKQAWIGFIKCCEKCVPKSFPVLLSLPPQQLKDVLDLKPELKQSLINHWQSTDKNQASFSEEIINAMDSLVQPSIEDAEMPDNQDII